MDGYNWSYTQTGPPAGGEDSWVCYEITTALTQKHHCVFSSVRREKINKNKQSKSNKLRNSFCMTCCCQHPGYHRLTHTLNSDNLNVTCTKPVLNGTFCTCKHILFILLLISKCTYDTYCGNTWVAQLFFMVYSEQWQYIFILFCSILFVKTRASSSKDTWLCSTMLHLPIPTTGLVG